MSLPGESLLVLLRDLTAAALMPCLAVLESVAEALLDLEARMGKAEEALEEIARRIGGGEEDEGAGQEVILLALIRLDGLVLALQLRYKYANHCKVTF